MIYLKVNTKSYRTLDYKKNIVNKIQKNKKAVWKSFFRRPFIFPCLGVDVLRQQGVVFDEGAARFDFVAHQGDEHFVGGNGVFDADF